MIVEFKDQISQFIKDYRSNDVIITPLYSDINLHVNMNRLCALHIKILNKKIYYLLPFNHFECNNLSEDVISKLTGDNKKYIYNKKKFIQLFDLDNLIDIETLNYLNTSKEYKIKTQFNSSQNIIINISDNILYVNEYIPIVKLMEYLNNLSDELQELISMSFLSSDKEYKSMDLSIKLFSKIEKNGICVDIDKMKQYFPKYSKYLTNTNIAYSEYNLYTLTGRPSNAYLKMNFSALNKSNGERECIISRFDGGKLLYVDYSSYHLNIIANIIKYEFPANTSIHKYLGTFYFGKDELTEDEYEDSKKLSFKFLYGGIPKEIADNIPFFDKVNLLIDRLYAEFKSNGYIKTHFFKRKVYIDNVNLTKNKIFNYYIQSLETEFNIKVLYKLDNYMKDKKSKLIMYLYDGFLFDMYPDEFDNIYQDILNIVSDNKFPYTKYLGKNFQNIKKF